MRGNLIMDHTAVVRDKMTERYLLNELDSDLRDQFEEHYFDCQECALDVSAGTQFVEQSKLILAERSEPDTDPVDSRHAPGFSRMAGLVSSGVCRAGSGASVAGCGVSESGNASRPASSTEAATGSARSLDQHGDLGCRRLAHRGA